MDEIERLIRRINEGSPAAAEKAIARLVALGPPAAARVVEALRSEDATFALGDVILQMNDPQLVPLLLPELSAESSVLVLTVMRALGRLRDPRAEGPLINVLTDARHYETDRAVAAEALSILGSAEAMEPLQAVAVTAMEAQEPRLALAATVALARLGDHSRVRIAVELVAYPDDPIVCAQAAKAMQTVVGPGVFAALAAALQDDFEETRRNAVDALFYLGTRECIEALASVLTDEDTTTAGLARRRIDGLTDNDPGEIGRASFDHWWAKNVASFPSDTTFRLGGPLKVGKLVSLLEQRDERADVAKELHVITGEDFGFEPTLPMPKDLVERVQRWLPSNGGRFVPGALYKYGRRQEIAPIFQPA